MPDTPAILEEHFSALGKVAVHASAGELVMCALRRAGHVIGATRHRLLRFLRKRRRLCKTRMPQSFGALTANPPIVQSPTTANRPQHVFRDGAGIG